MAKPTKAQQRDLDIRKETLRRQASTISKMTTKRLVSQGITKQAFHTILDKASQPISREAESDSKKYET